MARSLGHGCQYQSEDRSVLVGQSCDYRKGFDENWKLKACTFVEVRIVEVGMVFDVKQGKKRGDVDLEGYEEVCCW